MKEVVLKLLAFSVGAVGIAYGVYGVFSYLAYSSVDRRSYTNPPVLYFRQTASARALEPLYDLRVPYFEEKTDVLCRDDGVYEVATFRSFQQYTQDYWKGNPEEKPEVTISRASFLGRDYVSLAVARDTRTLLYYRPKLLILVYGYGDDAAFLALEESDFPLLRCITCSKKQVRETAEAFRKMEVPYCAITYSPTAPASLTGLLETALFPNQWILNKRKPTLSPSGEASETRALRVKRLLYDAILNAIDSGFGMIELEAGYLEITTLNHILEGLEPLPVSLTDLLFWSTEGFSSTGRVAS